MRAFVLIAALAVAAVNAHPAKEKKNGQPVVHGYKQGDPCPAKYFYDDCSSCTCSDKGNSAGCTFMMCYTDEDISAGDSDYPHNDAYSQTGECLPDQYFIDQCNVCKCDRDGKLASCTRKLCQPVKQVHIDGYRQGMKCPASETFYDQCNTCKCSSDGVSASCTLIACPSSRVARSVSDSAGIPHIDNFLEIQECTPGQRFVDICNTCICSNDGVTAACTAMACPPVDTPRIDGYQEGKKCPAGKTFRDRCNTCQCGANGKSALCNLIACPE